jgi:hypothetical protein
LGSIYNEKRFNLILAGQGAGTKKWMNGLVDIGSYPIGVRLVSYIIPHALVG